MKAEAAPSPECEVGAAPPGRVGGMGLPPILAVVADRARLPTVPPPAGRPPCSHGRRRECGCASPFALPSSRCRTSFHHRRRPVHPAPPVPSEGRLSETPGKAQSSPVRDPAATGLRPKMTGHRRTASPLRRPADQPLRATVPAPEDSATPPGSDPVIGPPPSNTDSATLRATGARLLNDLYGPAPGLTRPYRDAPGHWPRNLPDRPRTLTLPPSRRSAPPPSA